MLRVGATGGVRQDPVLAENPEAFAKPAQADAEAEHASEKTVVGWQGMGTGGGDAARAVKEKQAPAGAGGGPATQARAASV